MTFRYTKIVATVGPASAAPEMLARLHAAGVDVFRLNFSHGKHESHAAALQAIRAAEAESGRAIAVVADLQGPKLRVGEMPEEGVPLTYGQEIRLECAKAISEPGLIRIPHPELFAALSAGVVLKLDDGKMQLTILESGGDSAKARVDFGGRLTSRKGINLIGATLPVGALTDKDKADLEFACAAGVDYIALSFVQRPEDAREARVLIAGRAGLIVKLEKPSALDALDEILAEADAAMVARGDLGVELPPERVPIMQRRIVNACRAAGKPVIVATHMLESMVEAATPTRAEASDVANAVYQGADAVMLSAESAVGRHPTATVAVMERLIMAVEADPDYWKELDQRQPKPEPTTADAISQSAANIAAVLGCRAVAAYTTTGSTALRLSRDRPHAPILGLTPLVSTARRLVLAWGLRSIVTRDVDTFDEMAASAEQAAADWGVQKGERIVISAGVPFGRPGKTNTLKISRIGANEE